VYPSHVRRLLVFLTLAFAVGCRAPAIPAQPSSHEYAIYSAWMEQATADIPPQRTLAVDSETLTLNQAELQFKQCLPPRMTAVFDSAPVSTLLASTSGNDWLTLGNGRSASLHLHGDPLSFDRPTELFRVSRVAFTRSGYNAYLWVEHRSCNIDPAGHTCHGASGALVHGIKSNGSWTFENTTCHTITFPP